ncbi:MAG: hypothetical protein ACLR7U_02305 [Ruthenibacterium lactatiformans]
MTEDLKVLENKILGANERLAVLERQLFDDLLHKISAELPRIQKTASGVARLDVLTALAEVAVKNGYTKPVVDEGDELIIEEGRHPSSSRCSRARCSCPTTLCWTAAITVCSSSPAPTWRANPPICARRRSLR